ncbi:hypothetical protein M422DRAFT_270717 [Sphaerobolus stellatus SS14]|uniref:Uncharacterized protein n=1 Tax=Sphaerobolus stellatus (strain SS14) TaxID=990650 RepID=A0A0C9US44_SPHS4|nr:hypothetical protein M422DRAFT_270717 [Sphaerobolus stellatus SS14]
MPHIPNHPWLYPKSTVPAPQADTILTATRPAWNHMEEVIYDLGGFKWRGCNGSLLEVTHIVNAKQCRDLWE